MSKLKGYQKTLKQLSGRIIGSGLKHICSYLLLYFRKWPFARTVRIHDFKMGYIYIHVSTTWFRLFERITIYNCKKRKILQFCGGEILHVSVPNPEDYIDAIEAVYNEIQLHNDLIEQHRLEGTCGAYIFAKASSSL